jgi:hypothetical protein
MSGDSGDKEPSTEEVLIERARSGDAVAGRQLLRSISVGLMKGELHPALAAYHADCLWDYVHLGVSLERALHVYTYQSQATEYDPVELAAVFELLTEFGGMKRSQARTWIKEHIGAGKKVTENASAAVNIMALENFEQPAGHEDDASPTGAYRRQRYLDLLLHTAGSLRKFVVGSVMLK